MSCEGFEFRLQALLDERLRPENDAQLRRHGDACPACRSRLAAQAALWAGLATRPAPETSDDFVESVLRKVEHDRALIVADRFGAQGTHSAGWLTAVAAAIAIVLTPAAFWTYRAMHGAPDVVAEREQENTPPEIPPITEKTASDAPHEAVAAAPLPNEVHSGEAAVGSTLDGLTPEERYAMILERWQSQLPELGGRLGLIGDPPASPGAAAVSQLTDRIRSPLSSSLNATLNVLRTALPTGADQSPAKPQANRWPDAVDERVA